MPEDIVSTPEDSDDLEYIALSQDVGAGAFRRNIFENSPSLSARELADLFIHGDGDKKILCTNYAEKQPREFQEEYISHILPEIPHLDARQPIRISGEYREFCV